MRARCGGLVALVVLGLALPARAQTVGARIDAAHGCNGGSAGWGLTRQLARAQSCMYPDLLVEVSAGGGLTFSSTAQRWTTPQTRSALYGARACGASGASSDTPPFGLVLIALAIGVGLRRRR